MPIEDAILKTGIKAGTGTVVGAVAAARGAIGAPHMTGAGMGLVNQAAKAGFAGMKSFKHGHKLLPAVGAGAVVLAGPAVAAATVAAPFVLGAAVVGGAAFGLYKLFKD